MKKPVSKEEITMWLENGLVEVIRSRAAELGIQVESIIEDALFEVFEPNGLSRVYGERVPPTIKYRIRKDAEQFKRLES